MASFIHCMHSPGLLRGGCRSFLRALRASARISSSLRLLPPPLSVPCSSTSPNRPFSAYVSPHYRVDASALESLLSRHALAYKSTSTHYIIRYCPLCPKPHGDALDNQFKLYIRRTDGAHFCHRCGSSGSYFDLTRALNADRIEVTTPTVVSTPSSPQSFPSTVDTTQFKSWCDTLCTSTEEGPTRTREWLQKRGLHVDTLRRFQVGYMRRRFIESTSTSTVHDCVVFPWFKSGECTRFKLRSIDVKSCQLMLPKGGTSGCFGLDLVPPDAVEVVLTEGEVDALSVWQATGAHAVSLPNGARSFPLDLIPAFERFNRIILWMDDDASGREGQLKLVNKLGSGRCAIVKHGPVQGRAGADGAAQVVSPKDANEALQKGVDLNAILATAAVQRHEQVASFLDLKASVLREVAAGLTPPSPGEVPSTRSGAGVPYTSLPSLQRVLKGHRSGEMSILTGPTGSGKTTLLSQLSLELSGQGVRTLWGSFEIKTTRLIAAMLAQVAGGGIPLPSVILDAAPVEEVVSDAAKVESAKHAVTALLAGRDTLSPPSPAAVTMQGYESAAEVMSRMPLHFLRFYGSTDVDAVIDALTYASYVHDIEHVILDNLQFMMSSSTTSRGFERFDAQERALDRFRAFATKHDVHLTLVIHPRKEAEDAPLSMASVFGSAKATQEADSVLILQRVADGRKYLDVKKNRYDGTLGSIPLLFDANSRCFREDPSPRGASGGGSSSGGGGGAGSYAPSGQRAAYTTARGQTSHVPAAVTKHVSWTGATPALSRLPMGDSSGKRGMHTLPHALGMIPMGGHVSAVQSDAASSSSSVVYTDTEQATAWERKVRYTPASNAARGGAWRPRRAAQARCRPIPMPRHVWERVAAEVDGAVRDMVSSRPPALRAGSSASDVPQVAATSE